MQLLTYYRVDKESNQLYNLLFKSFCIIIIQKHLRVFYTVRQAININNDLFVVNKKKMYYIRSRILPCGTPLIVTL